MTDSLPDRDILRRLLGHLAGTDIDELELEVGTTRVFLRREPSATAPIAVRPTAATIETGGTPIAAPLTGVFYSRPSPDQSPYVSVGQQVVPGEVVALIETMKMFNEVLADVAGEISAIVAEDNQLVEAGQPILFLRPSDEKVVL